MPFRFIMLFLCVTTPSSSLIAIAFGVAFLFYVATKHLTCTWRILFHWHYCRKLRALGLFVDIKRKVDFSFKYIILHNKTKINKQVGHAQESYLPYAKAHDRLSWLDFNHGNGLQAAATIGIAATAGSYVPKCVTRKALCSEVSASQANPFHNFLRDKIFVEPCDIAL